MKPSFIFAVLILLESAAALPKYNGVSFISLNGWGGAHDEPLCTVLENQNTNTAGHNYPDELDKTFRAYQQAGVNLIRLVIDPNWRGCDSHPEYWPALSAYTPPTNIGGLLNWISMVNTLASTANQYGIKTSLTLSPTEMGGNNQFLPPYDREKKWLETWLTHIDLNNIVFVNLAAELFWYNWGENGVYKYAPIAAPVTDLDRRINNHWDYAGSIWSWFMDSANPNHTLFQTIPASIEVFTPSIQLTSPCGAGYPYTQGGMMYRANPTALSQLADMIYTKLPGAAAASMEFYFTIDKSTPPCTSTPAIPTASEYFNTTQSLLNAYFSSSAYQNGHLPLWIDEFGHPICNAISLTSCPATETYQANYYEGTLSAMNQQNDILSRIAWAGSAESPFLNDGELFGIFSGYDANNQPIPRPAWDNMRFYYPNNLTPIYSLLLAN